MRCRCNVPGFSPPVRPARRAASAGIGRLEFDDASLELSGTLRIDIAGPAADPAKTDAIIFASMVALSVYRGTRRWFAHVDAVNSGALCTGSGDMR